MTTKYTNWSKQSCYEQNICATNKYDRNQTAKTPKITTELLHSTSQQNSEHAKNKLNYIELLHITTIAKRY